LIARADNTGLGTQTWELYRHIKPYKTLVIDYATICGWPHNKQVHPERYPGATFTQGNPTPAEYAEWLRDLDVVFTCETAYGSYLYTLARQLNVRTVLQPNYEMLELIRHPHPHGPDLFAAPTTWHYDDLPEPKTLLPVPIALDRFVRPVGKSVATRFLHVVGKPAVHDRNGTETLLAALQYVKSLISVTIKTQDPNLAQVRYPIPGNVDLRIVNDSPDDYWDNYPGYDVLVMPRRYGGLCLPAQEAIGAGMPVIMPDVSPNEWLPAEWLVNCRPWDSFWAHNEIRIYDTDLFALAALIDKFATDQAFYEAAKARAADLGKEMSWDNLLPVYEQCFTQLVS
jgi:hypothetical protein